MRFSSQELCNLLNGTLEGDPDIIITKPSKIEESDKDCVTFLANPKYESYLSTTKASVVVVSEGFSSEKPPNTTLIRVKDPYTSFSLILDKFQNGILNKKGVETPSYQSKTSKIGQDVYLGAFSYLGENVKIGDNVKIYPNAYIGDHSTIEANTIIFSGVKIYHNTIIGANCIIHAGAVIGSDGFGFAPQKDGSYKKIAQIGNVIIEDNVEIGANTTIDRATVGSTVIRKGVKLDNQIQVAHNVEIGENTAIAAQTGISGSSKIGKNSALGGQVGIVGHINIAEGSRIGAQSGVPNSIEEKNKSWLGSPISEQKQALKAMIIQKKLPELIERINAIEKLLKEQDKA